MASALAKQATFSRPVRSQAISRSAVRVHAALPARPLWLPGAQVPAHLKGEMAGDFGFDPLGLGKDPEALRWYQQAELVHARTAMAAVAGILFPAILSKAGVLNVPDWFDAGKEYYKSANPLPFGALLAVQLFLTGFVETKRWYDFRKPGSQSDEKGSFFGFEQTFGNNKHGYPGGVFDPLGFSRGGDAQLQDYKIKEIKNGRLAMVAFLGFVAQHAATGKGPIDNLVDHVRDPWHATFAENGVSVPFLNLV